jgi:hypothetical protein
MSTYSNSDNRSFEQQAYQQRLDNVLKKFEEMDNEKYFIVRKNAMEICYVDDVFLLETSGIRNDIKISLETVESLLADLSNE